MKFADRILTIVVTATLTSAAWIVFGGTWLEQANERQDEPGTNLDAADPGDTGDPGGMDDGPVEGSAGEGTEPPVAGSEPRDGSVSQAALQIPVEGVEAGDLSDTFLDRRGAEGGRTHEAIDIMAPIGTAVIAAREGTVSKLHNSDAGGKTIYVRSPDRLTIYYYAHLDSYASGLREGQRVRAGQRLGTVGSTGNANLDAPHLHFALIETTQDARWWEPGTALNPYPLLTAGSR